jgi:hypothetical protein
MPTITTFDDSIIQIESGPLRLKKYSLSDYSRRKSAPWVYFEPNEISSPAYPPEYAPVSVKGDNVVTLCGDGVTLNVDYVLDPISYSGDVDIFWEQRTGASVTIDDPTLKNPTLSYSSNSTFDFIMRVYIDKGTDGEIFSDVLIIRTPVGTNITGVIAMGRKTVDSININRSGVKVQNASSTLVSGINTLSANPKYLSNTRSSAILRESFDIGKFSQIPSTVSQTGASLPPYKIEDIGLTQINWSIIPYKDIFRLYSVQIYENEILVETYYSKIQSYIVPVSDNVYSVALSYINSITGEIFTIHKDQHAVANVFNKVGSDYKVDILAQDIVVTGFQSSSIVTQLDINRSGVVVQNASSTLVSGVTTDRYYGAVSITRVNGISIGN